VNSVQQLSPRELRRSRKSSASEKLSDVHVDGREKHLDLIVESVYVNSGRGCINCSGIWASRHTKEIAEAVAEKIGPVEALPPTDSNAGYDVNDKRGGLQSAGCEWELRGAGLCQIRGATNRSNYDHNSAKNQPKVRSE